MISKTAAATAMRRHRDRKRRGVVQIVGIEVTDGIIAAMVADGIFTGHDDKKLTRESLTRAVQVWVNGAAGVPLPSATGARHSPRAADKNA